MTLTVVNLDDLPADVRELALKHGRRQGNRVAIEPAALRHVLSQSKAEETTGLGDVVAAFAQPIARAIDKLAGTKIASCGGCAKRRKKLNEAFPWKK